MAASAATLDHFGRHVHGRAGHRSLFTATCSIVDSKGPTLAGYKLGGTEIDELDDTVVVEEDI